jgi:hypothetical protein
MEYQFNIPTAKLKEMCKRSSYAIATDKSNQRLRSYHIRMALGELEVTCTDGFRLCYQTFMIPSTEEQEPWSVAVEKDVLEAALKACHWPEVRFIATPVSAGGLWKVSICNALNLGECIQVEGNQLFKADMTTVISKRNPSRAEATVTARRLEEILKEEEGRAPITYKGMDNDDIIFFYIAQGTVGLNKGMLIDLEGSEGSVIQKKFISEAIKSMDKKGTVQARVVETPRQKGSMLILEDKDGGHVIMPTSFKEKKKIKDLKSEFYFRNCYFRVPGFAATFYYSKGVSYIVDGARPPQLEGYKLFSRDDSYDFKEDLDIFIETKEEGKKRVSRQRNLMRKQ